MNSFWSHRSRFQSFTQLNSSMDLNSVEREANNSSIETTTVQSNLQYRDIRLMTSLKKRVLEEYSVPIAYMLIYDLKKSQYVFGNLKLRSVNPLVVGSAFGRSFYPGQFRVSSSTNNPFRFDRSGQSSNGIFGFAARYRSDHYQFNIAYGRHDYYSSLSEGRFSSFNSTRPISEHKNPISENQMFIESHYHSEIHHFVFSYLDLHFSKPHLFERDFYQSKNHAYEIYGLSYIFDSDRVRLKFNSALQNSDLLNFDSEIQFKFDRYQVYANHFNYDDQFTNPKSRAILQGSTNARNREGQTFAIKRNTFFYGSFEFGFMRYIKTSDESRNEFNRFKDKQFISVKQKFKSLKVDTYLSGNKWTNRRATLKYYFYELILGYTIRSRLNDMAHHFSGRFKGLFAELSIINTYSYWAIYEMGFPNEFIFSRFHSDAFRGLVSYQKKFDDIAFGLKYRFIHQEKKNFELSGYRILGHNRHSLSLFISHEFD